MNDVEGICLLSLRSANALSLDTLTRGPCFKLIKSKHLLQALNQVWGLYPKYLFILHSFSLSSTSTSLLSCYVP